jgi:ribonuclease VapC
VSSPTVVVDASAVVAWARDERGADVVEKVLPLAAVSAANLSEALVICVDRGWTTGVRRLQELITSTGVQVLPNTEHDSARAAELILSAGRRHERRVLSLGDGLCLALAERLGVPVTGGDTAWEQLDLKVIYAPFR